MNNAVLLDKGIKCLVDGLEISQPFDYTEWRKRNLCVDMSVEEISEAADKYCSRLGLAN